VKLNVLDILEKRRVDFCPPHFSTHSIKRVYNLEKVICQWINDHLSGRYYLGKNIKLDGNNGIEGIYTIGFENPKELSFFMLACPYLKYN